MELKTGARAGLVALAAAVLAGGPSRVVAEEDAFQLLRLGGGAYLGVNLGEVAAADVSRLGLGEERGAIVRDVKSGSPAEKAGLQKDDVIVGYQGEPIRSAAQLARMVRETPAGRKVALEVSRGGSTQRLTATLDEGGGPRALLEHFPHVELPGVPLPPDPPDAPEPPEPPVAPKAFRWRWDGDGKDHAFVLRDRLRVTGPRRLGLTYQELSDQLAAYFKVDGGLLVSDVDADGPAAKAGIKAGDVIVKYDGADVESSGDLHDKLARGEPGSEVALTVQRDGKPVEVKVTLGGEKKLIRKKRGITT